MSLYAIGDLHLCLGAAKPMDIFGGAWVGYMEKLKEGVAVIRPEDTTVLLGDLSWALDLANAKADFITKIRKAVMIRTIYFCFSISSIRLLSSSTEIFSS